LQDEGEAVNEAEYWMSLEFRLCGEFAGMADRHLRYLWCDGFIPQEYLLDASCTLITGRVWICNGRRQDEWEFTLFLPQSVGARDQINWAALLPPENVTRWLSVDPAGRRIQIEPAAAVPDLI
jgi:hypothetical protein